MKTNKSEILIVDDDSAAVQTFAELIEAQLNIKAYCTTDPEEALDHIKDGSIKVAILDQRMPKMTGTDLFSKIKAFNPYIRAIMLTGEASREEVAKAMQMGYCDYLEKNKISELSKKTLNALAKYEVEISKTQSSFDPVPIKVFLPWNNRCYTKRFYVISLIKGDELNLNKWCMTLELDASEMEVEDSYTFENEIILSTELEQKNTMSIAFSNLKIADLKSQIDNVIMQKYSSTFTTKMSKTQRKKIKYNLQEGAERGKSVVKKVFERAPMYLKFTVVIREDCSICGGSKIKIFDVYKQIPKTQSRVTLYYSDNTRATVVTDVMSY